MSTQSQVSDSLTYSSQCRWNDFGSIGGGDDLEDTPRDTGQQVTDQDHLDVLSEEKDKDTGSHGAHSNHVYGPVAVLGLSPSVDQQSDDLSTRSCVVDTGLPVLGDKSLAALGVERSELVNKGALTEEIVDLEMCQLVGLDVAEQCGWAAEVEAGRERKAITLTRPVS